MNYWTDLFTPETYEAFTRSDRSVSGFRETQRGMAERVRVGDKFICYMVRMSRWIGVLEVLDGPFVDDTPIFLPEVDPFIIRFKVSPTAWLPINQTLPIQDEAVFSRLTFTRSIQDGGYWLGPLRRSLHKLDDEDGQFLTDLLVRQSKEQKTFEVDHDHYERALKHRIQRPDGSVTVTVPDDLSEPNEDVTQTPTDRESIRIQADLCRIGAAMGMKVWLPNADRSRVGEHWKPQAGVLLERLPLN